MRKCAKYSNYIELHISSQVERKCCVSQIGKCVKKTTIVKENKMNERTNEWMNKWMNERANYRFLWMILKFIFFIRRRCVYVFAKTRVILLIAHASERFQCEARKHFTLYHVAADVVKGSFFNSFVPLSIP